MDTRLQTEHERKRMSEIMIAAHEMAQKKHDDPAMALMHELMHAAIAIAGDHGRERSRIAMALGIAKDTLDTRLGSKPDKPLTPQNIARLMFDPSVLGDEVHAWLMEQVALRVARTVLLPACNEASGGPEREMIEVIDACGFAGSTVHEITDPLSDGGVAVTPMEQRKLGAAVAGIMHECRDLIKVDGTMAGVGVML